MKEKFSKMWDYNEEKSSCRPARVGRPRGSTAARLSDAFTRQHNWPRQLTLHNNSLTVIQNSINITLLKILTQTLLYKQHY